MRKNRKLFKNNWNQVHFTFILGVTLLAVILFILLFAPLLIRFDPIKMDLAQKFIAPCSKFWLGTDHMGRDIFSRMIAGSRISLGVALTVIGISTGIGMTIGLISGYCGGKIDMVLMRLVDVLLAFPTIIFALAISAALGTGQRNLVIAICCVQWTRYARIARGEVLLIKNAEYIEAAKAIGNQSFQIIIKYILPAVISKILVLASMDIGTIILYCASFSFLGLGAQPPSPDWGVMINEGKEYMRYAPWIALFPGLAITISTLAFNLIGDGFRDFLDPHMHEAGKVE